MAQLDDNLLGLDVALTEADMAVLDRVSKPTLAFPVPFLEAAPTIMHSGATVDGVASEPWPMAPQNDEERY